MTRQGTKIQALISRGDGSFVSEPRRIPAALPSVTGYPAFTVRDLDGDGDDDIIVKNFNSDFSKHVGFALVNDGKGTFARLTIPKLPQISPRLCRSRH